MAEQFKLNKKNPVQQNQIGLNRFKSDSSLLRNSEDFIWMLKRNDGKLWCRNTKASVVV